MKVIISEKARSLVALAISLCLLVVVILNGVGYIYGWKYRLLHRA